jgi:hypothetical protein
MPHGDMRKIMNKARVAEAARGVIQLKNVFRSNEKLIVSVSCASIEHRMDDGHESKN